GVKDHESVTKGLLVKAKGNVLGLEIIKDQSGNTLRVSQSRIHNKKLVQTLLKGHSTLSLEDSLSGDCDVEKNGYVFVDFDYAMRKSITVMGYLTFTKAWKKKIWLKGLLTESRYELSIVAGIATGACDTGIGIGICIGIGIGIGIGIDIDIASRHQQHVLVPSGFVCSAFGSALVRLIVLCTCLLCSHSSPYLCDSMLYTCLHLSECALVWIASE
nr:zinc finger, CCHC-type [Tanacetum cinerariifolium]